MMFLSRRPWRPRRLRRRFFTSIRHGGPGRPHFDGRKFQNVEPTERWARQVMRWMMTRKPERWPRWQAEPPGPKPPAQVDGNELRITFVNHATVLIQTAGLNILTDPVWSRRVGPFPWLGPARVRPPGVRFEDLPRIDCILVSHDHYDHMDVPTLRRLIQRDKPRLLAGLGVERTLEIDGLAGAETLDWHETRALSADVAAVFTPCQHFSGRGLKDQDSTLWGSFLLKTPAGAVYFAGDTGYGPHFRELRDLYGNIRVALLPIGCYEPRWFMRPYHMSPTDAVQAHQDLGAAVSIGIHHGTFRLGDEGIEQPRIDLTLALKGAHLPPSAFLALGFGEAWTGKDEGVFVPPSQLEVVLTAESW